MTNQRTVTLVRRAAVANHSGLPSRQDRLSEAIDEFYISIDAGRPLDRARLLEKYADIADELEDCLHNLDFIHNIAPELAADDAPPLPPASLRAAGEGSLRSEPGEGGSQSASSSMGNHSSIDSQRAHLGDFRILRELGRGGMGVVYEAEQLSLGRRVAVKVLPFAAMLDKQQLNRFKNEARAAATLDHPNIVAIYSVGCERGVHYYAMQLIEGQSLAEVIEQVRADRTLATGGDLSIPAPSPRRGGLGRGDDAGTRSESNIQHPASNIDTAAIANEPTLPAPRSTLPAFSSREYYRAIARLGIQAAEALDHAHQNGILHRDIKPANLLVDDTGKLWITDFGLARIEQDAGMTMTGDLLGTLRYMSPEQALAKRVVVDHRSDVYSLGITLYELLTLRPAFGGEDRHELLRKIALEEPRRPGQLNAQIHQDLETIVLKAIEKNPCDRYATAQHLADDLRRYSEHQSIHARRPTVLQRGQKLVRRHRTAAIFIAILSVLGLVFGAMALADRSRFILEHTRFVELSLQAARSALESNDIEQAMLRLGEAQTRIEATGLPHDELAMDVAKTTEEVARYNQFIKLCEESREHQSEENPWIPASKKALSLYNVMEKATWLATLREAKIPEAHVRRVADLVYEMLLQRADDLTRWNFGLPKSIRRQQSAENAKQALACLERAASFHAPSRGYYWLLANCARIQHDTDREAGLRKTALETAPHSAAELFYINRDHLWGSVSKDKGYPSYSFEQNYKDHRDMLRSDPTYFNGLHYMGYRLYLEGRYQEALPVWYGCIALRPNDYYSLGFRARTHWLLQQTDEAIVDANRLIELDPHVIGGWTTRGLCYWKLGQFKNAVADFEKAVEIKKSNGFFALHFPMRMLAWLLGTAPVDELRNGARAVELGSQACELTNYTDSEDVRTLAAANAEKGDFTAAVNWAEKGLELVKDDKLRDTQLKQLKKYQMHQPWRDTDHGSEAKILNP